MKVSSCNMSSATDNTMAVTVLLTDESHTNPSSAKATRLTGLIKSVRHASGG